MQFSYLNNKIFKSLFRWSTYTIYNTQWQPFNPVGGRKGHGGTGDTKQKIPAGNSGSP